VLVHAAKKYKAEGGKWKKEKKKNLKSNGIFIII
jgi:hypothetical protein